MNDRDSLGRAGIGAGQRKLRAKVTPARFGIGNRVRAIVLARAFRFSKYQQGSAQGTGERKSHREPQCRAIAVYKSLIDRLAGERVGPSWLRQAWRAVLLREPAPRLRYLNCSVSDQSGLKNVREQCTERRYCQQSWHTGNSINSLRTLSPHGSD
jgi:hypothetical protein